ncbi:MAG: glycosyltransferase family 9 protein [Mucilaginibacter sp.]|nr:glycosyltransferase family 9 protein [Mucilaginibacter sp.]
MKSIRYRFSPNVSPKKIRLIKFIDEALFFLRGKAKEHHNVEIKEITITQLAHIGDLILLLPALKKLKALTNYKINLVVSSQNYSIASKMNFLDSVTVVDAPYFARNGGASYKKFIKQLRTVKSDLIVDVRGDLRNIVFIKAFTRHKLFAGYDVGGGEGLLDIVFPYGFNDHITGLIDPLFNYLKLPDTKLEAYWHHDDLPFEIVEGYDFSSDFMVVHLGAGAMARKWPFESFLKVIKELSTDLPVYVLGTHADASESEIEQLNAVENVNVCIGKFNILQSIYIVKNCKVFLGLDSGFTHIAAMCKRKVFVLFSGAANKVIWNPYNFYDDQVTLINYEVECNQKTGCGKLVCDDNICMKYITPGKVINSIKLYLKTDDVVHQLPE